MKIQCDVCSKKEASVFCSADEAALCDVCDQRVHHANKLASKHERFSLIHPSQAPLCDICQEKRAVLFCQQDRAIMCRDCELPLHTTNEHTQKHSRFLLTGVKLDKISDNANNRYDHVPDFKPSSKKTSFSSENPSWSTTLTHGGGDGDCTRRTFSVNDDNNNNKLVPDGSTSSISEYLINLLPGWHFEDFIVDSFSSHHDHYSPFGSCKFDNMNEFEATEEEVSFKDVDVFDKKQTSCSLFTIQEENLGICVPQAPTKATILYGEQVNYENIGELVQRTKQQETNVRATKGKGNPKSRKSNNHGFAVPQITTPNKRIRHFD